MRSTTGRTCIPGRWTPGAGGRPHTFTIVFGLRDKPVRDGSRLVVRILDRNLPEPPLLRIALNDYADEFQMPAGSHYMLEERVAGGVPLTVTMPLPADSFRAGDNTLTLTTTAGCWLVYDSIALEGPADLTLTETRAEDRDSTGAPTGRSAARHGEARRRNPVARTGHSPLRGDN